MPVTSVARPHWFLLPVMVIGRQAAELVDFFVGWIGCLGVLQKSWGRFEDVVVKETGASNAPGWGETESSDPNKSHKPGIWWLDCLNKNDLSRGLYLVGNFEYSTYFCRLFFFRQTTNFNIFIVWQWRQWFLCFLAPLTHLTFRTSWKTSTIHVHVGKYTIIRPMDPSWFSWNFGRWWTTCWTRPRIVLRSMPLMTLTRQPCIMQPGGHCFGKVDGWKVDTGGTFFFFGWQFWERKTWSHTSQIYDKHDGYSWWFQTFFCFPQFFTFTSCLGTRHEILNLTKYFSTGLKSLPSVISRISRLMSRAKLFLVLSCPSPFAGRTFCIYWRSSNHPVVRSIEIDPGLFSLYQGGEKTREYSLLHKLCKDSVTKPTRNLWILARFLV